MRPISFGKGQNRNKESSVRHAIAAPVAVWTNVKPDLLIISFFCRWCCCAHSSNCHGAPSTKLYQARLLKALNPERSTGCNHSVHVCATVHTCIWMWFIEIKVGWGVGVDRAKLNRLHSETNHELLIWSLRRTAIIGEDREREREWDLGRVPFLNFVRITMSGYKNTRIIWHARAVPLDRYRERHAGWMGNSHCNFMSPQNSLTCNFPSVYIKVGPRAEKINKTIAIWTWNTQTMLLHQ